jgi:hypothetical protein
MEDRSVEHLAEIFGCCSLSQIYLHFGYQFRI